MVCTSSNNQPPATCTSKGQGDQPKIRIENRTIGVEIFPNPPKPKTDKGVNQKYLEYLELMSKHWRLVQLAIPKLKRKKYAPTEEKEDASKKLVTKLPDHVSFFTEHLALPSVRALTKTKQEHEATMGKRWAKKMKRNITKTWETIYNYYNKKKRDQKRYQLKRLQQKQKKKMSAKDFFKSKETFYSQLAKPKEVPKPAAPKEPKEKRPINYERLTNMAVPKQKIYSPPTFKEISKNALKYVASPRIHEIAKVPMRYYKIKPPLVPGKVKRSALKYVATETILKMTQPIVRHCDKKVIVTQTETDNADCFKVKPSALKYKITPRLKKLAEPKERK